MTLQQLFVQVVDALNRERIPYFLIGGLAVSAWVEPRATKDMDVVFRVRRKDAPRVKTALVAAGMRATSLEIRLLMEKRFVRFKTGGPLLDVKICSSAHDVAAFERSKELELDGRRLRVATPEDLVLYKLQAWRPIDQRDLLVLVADFKALDAQYVESWLDRISRDTALPLRTRWERIRAEA